MKRKLLIFLSILGLSLGLISICSITAYAEEEPATETTETTETYATETTEKDEAPNEENVLDDTTLMSQWSVFLDNWLTPIVSCISGIAGIILGICLLLSKIKKIIFKFKETHEINEEEVKELKADYNKLIEEAKAEKEKLIDTIKTMEDNTQDLKDTILQNEKIKTELIQTIGVMITSIPQFVASGKADEIMKIVNKLETKVDEIVEEAEEENEVE